MLLWYACRQLSNGEQQYDGICCCGLLADSYLTVNNTHNLPQLKKEWSRLYSPQETIKNTSCLSFLYLTRYVDIKIYKYVYFTKYCPTCSVFD